MTNITARDVVAYRPLVVPVKIFDADEDDSDVHVCSIPASIAEDAIAIVITIEKKSGTGGFVIYPQAGGIGCLIPDKDLITLPVENRRIKYALVTPNDTFDISLFGTWHKGPIGK